MDDNIEKLKNKYHYDEKTIKALTKVLPQIINYYGDIYQHIIKEALENCKIITCSSFETIISIINKDTFSKEINGQELLENDNRYGTGVYFSSPDIFYDSSKNIFVIRNINREIIISHTYNLDSPKGLEILTYCLCSLIKSYINEYKIDGNNIIKRRGFAKETRKIDSNERTTLNYIDSYGTGFEKGVNVYDTAKIVSMVLHDEYKCYEYSSLHEIILVLKEKLGLKKIIEESQIKDTDSFMKAYNNENSYQELLKECDECMSLEQNMIIYDVTREEKDKTLAKITKKLNNDIYFNFIKFLKKRQTSKIERVKSD